MATQQTALLWAALSTAALLYGMAWAQSGPSVPMEYCATINTADMEPINWNWQSDGRCAGNCTDLKFAYAIVLEKDCWCSNLAPNKADQRPIADCNYPCPGYPSDLCGGFGVYGYMEVAGSRPSGTAPPSNPTPTNTAASSTSSRPSSSSSSQSSTTSSDSGAVMTTITVGGTVKTVTATPSATGGASTSPSTTNSSSGLKTGAIVGIVIGVLAALGVFALFLYLFLTKRRRSSSPTPPHTPNGLPSPGGTTTAATPQTGEISEAYTPGSTGGGAWTPAGGKRRSHLMPVDPRLDPFAKGIYSGGEGRRSRESFNSLRDDQDYSRRVHVAPRVLR
ncbi:hypothetical protein C8A05DRAFT_29833, partial [Staphylotrichum tortipilum]